jgi:hypothetical protein
MGSIFPAEMSCDDVKSVVCSFSAQSSSRSTLCSVTTRSFVLSASSGLPRAFKFSVVWAAVFFNMTIVAKRAKPIGIQNLEQTSHRSWSALSYIIRKRFCARHNPLQLCLKAFRPPQQNSFSHLSCKTCSHLLAGERGRGRQFKGSCIRFPCHSPHRRETSRLGTPEGIPTDFLSCCYTECQIVIFISTKDQAH